ncbi:minor tail protein [Mycobacterium phage Butters]|uniref:Minor tail protein n=1 Tax=Mycobacterium phage Butters TaxID=1296646 RepID=M4W8K8_9CAUD|nr:minor tail protein [Mycobacterium phage Butters]WAW19103.1 minor tail protein [Mycobacterium phage BIB10]WAW19165.1 minor tail protein [Mycobacterium phage BIB9]WAW19227.1 minor tail protein [Mycobacterium phage BIB8]WAW19289.1 minor tail protein [Mycobacterium phage BIB7]WAW19351.1 minor tail protein [Mycobacterium phage BIB6]WAW19413.1 minor tail protein [Mycobacterium phage BIB4]WAW19475.1 minor tail protein [Mycobacterium phage BIB3]WAW19537.1 minor tail protein [Mycobacterium phage 
MTTKRYPAGQITSHGWYHVTKGTRPMMWLESWDKTVRFDLLGGLAAPFHDPTEPECVELVSLKGLIAPWKHIQQKGATQDGITHVDALLDPNEIEMTVNCVGRTPNHAVEVARDLIASIDAINTATVNFFTPDLGHWWSDIRWLNGAPQDALNVVAHGKPLSLRLQGDAGLWRSYDNVSMFTFSYEDMTDTFTEDNRSTKDLGDVPQYYTGDGGGYCTSDGDRMVWVDDPDDPFATESRRVINGPWPGFETATDNQVISQVHGGVQEWSVPESARNILGGRMGRDSGDAWDGSGVFAEYGIGYVRLFYTDEFVEHTMRVEHLPMLVPPAPGETFTLVCGYDGDPRLFKVLRNGNPILTHKETGSGSPLGPNNRGAGNGMFAAAAVLTQATPAAIRKISAGDNASMTQSGWLDRVNIGDQKMYDDYTLFGPGTFRLYDGPGANEYVEFGPLLQNQIVFLRTDPRVNTTLVHDLTVTPPSPQDLNIFQEAVTKLLKLTGVNGTAMENQIRSLFGIRTAQGNLYKYLKGRFSERAAIPPKPAGQPAPTYRVKVEIVGGNADSKVIAAGTPLRRSPF